VGDIVSHGLDYSRPETKEVHILITVVDSILFTKYAATVRYYRCSLTKKCRVKKLAVVKVAKKIANNDIFGHQKDWNERISLENEVTFSDAVPEIVVQIRIK